MHRGGGGGGWVYSSGMHLGYASVVYGWGVQLRDLLACTVDVCIGGVQLRYVLGVYS